PPTFLHRPTNNTPHAHAQPATASHPQPTRGLREAPPPRRSRGAAGATTRGPARRPTRARPPSPTDRRRAARPPRRHPPRGARDGSVVTEVHDGELVTQTVQLPEGCYINLGPGRLPHHHRRILALCRELRVPLEPYIMSSDANYYADAATGARYRRRRLDHDA